ncbi:hypothetical protein BG618_05332 [Pseudonocardia autotrophica]|nr:hypothetical protein BG618_05332 [Pseudonocardia autotrophica]
MPDEDLSASGRCPIRSCAGREIHRVSPEFSRSETESGGSVSMPSRSQPDSANTPGWKALNMTSSRCTRRMRSTSSGPMSSSAEMPSEAAMTVAVVQAIPFVVKIRL